MNSQPEPSPAHLEPRVFLALGCLMARLTHGVGELLKSSGLTATQYHALSILRGAGGCGLAGRQVGERLTSQVPDVTRLLDRLEAQGLVTRSRAAENRRVVQTRITATGLELLERYDTPMLALHRQQFSNLSEEQLRQLLALLEEAHGPPPKGTTPKKPQKRRSSMPPSSHRTKESE